MRDQIFVLESKIGMFVSQFIDLKDLTIEQSSEEQIETMIDLLNKKVSSMKSYDISEIPSYLEDCKVSCSEDKQYQTLAEVEEYIY